MRWSFLLCRIPVSYTHLDVYKRQDFYGGDTVYAKIVDFATKTPSNTTGAFYYDARDAVGVALSNITQTGADVDSELQTAQETLDFNMGM